MKTADSIHTFTKKLLLRDQLFRQKHKIYIKNHFWAENRDYQICNMMTEIVSLSDM